MSKLNSPRKTRIPPVQFFYHPYDELLKIWYDSNWISSTPDKERRETILLGLLSSFEDPRKRRSAESPRQPSDNVVADTAKFVLEQAEALDSKTHQEK